MIHVICLNPALDKAYAIDGFAAGEDYPGQTPEVHVGGKGVNVARVLSQLGENVHLYAFLGRQGGDAFRRDMEPRCACTWIDVDGASRTTINILDRLNGRETVITEAGPRVSAADVSKLMAALSQNIRAGDIVCCSGSIIAGAPKDLYAQISRMCDGLGAACALDCNAGTLPASLEGARYALGKPNERELCTFLDEARTDDPERIAALARRVMPPYDALLVSMGASGGVYIGKDGAWRATVPGTDVVSTVGSGDASFAGALCGMVRGLAPAQTLRLAMACGVANAMRGGYGSVGQQDVEAISRRIRIDDIG